MTRKQDRFFLNMAAKLVFFLFTFFGTGITSPAETIGIHTELPVQVTNTSRKNVAFFVTRVERSTLFIAEPNHDLAILGHTHDVNIREKYLQQIQLSFSEQLRFNLPQIFSSHADLFHIS